MKSRFSLLFVAFAFMFYGCGEQVLKASMWLPVIH
jgi:hypothetical protein